MDRCEVLTLDTVGGEETDVARLQGILMGELRGAGLRLGLSCQGGVVHLHRETHRDRESQRDRVSDAETTERVRSVSQDGSDRCSTY